MAKDFCGTLFVVKSLRKTPLDAESKVPLSLGEDGK